MWFRYPTRKAHWVLRNFNLKIKAMESLAIVGESGQGKSTLVALIMRFYDIQKGCILIDGVDIRELNIVELRARMGLVM